MGVLDDAIREHLELKRRHGVAEEELRRQEEEALGPARREVAPAEADNADGAGAVPAEEQEAVPTADAEVAHADEPEMAELSEAELADETRPPDPELLPAGEQLPHAAEERQADELPEEIALSEDAEPSGPEAELDHDPPLSAEPPETGVEDSPLEEAPAGQETAFYDVEESFAGEDEGPRIGDTPPQGFSALDDDLLDDEEEPAEDEPAEDEPAEDDDEDADVLEDTPDFLQETPEHDRLWFEQKPPRDFDFD